jgi:adenosylcobinamide-GDP ribazoletransferase
MAAMIDDLWVQRRINDVKIAFIFLTRLPFRVQAPIARGDLSQALWVAPLAGIAVGLVGAAAYALAHRLGIPPLPAALLAVAATALVTGALHEDGLADVADGFGGGGTRERKLDIMRDSRIGTYGVCALIFSFVLRVAALASLEEPSLVAAALIAAHAAGRSPLAAFMLLVPPARSDGLSADAGQPPPVSAAVALVLGLVALLLALGFGGCVTAAVFLAGTFGLLAWLSRQQIGGQTGDVLGALEQIGEIVVLLIAAALFAPG